MRHIYKGYTFEIKGSAGLWRWYLIATPQEIFFAPRYGTKFFSTKGAAKLSAEFYIDSMVQA